MALIVAQRVQSPSTRGRDGIFVKSSRCSTSQESVQLWISERLNVLWKIGETNPAGHTHGKASKRSTEDQLEWLHFDLAWSCLCVEPAELS